MSDPGRRRRRERSERRFRACGAIAIGIAMLALAVLLVSVAWRGYGAFFHSQLELAVHLDGAVIDPEGGGSLEALARADYTALARSALRERFPEASGRRERKQLHALLSSGAGDVLREQVLADPSLIGSTRTFRLPLSSDAELYVKSGLGRDLPESGRRLSDPQLAWLDRLMESGAVATRFNAGFLIGGDSREPELAGVGGAVVGSFLTLMVTLLVCFPIGVAAAVHLEEFAPRNRWTDWVEVNINNLAAVPSIVFGLLGLAIFLGFFGMTRSAPLVGGLVLALRTLPIVIIVSRTALAAVPPSIREAALGLGASRLQLVAHHLLPMALPGILTGTIIGMAQALGETAPLLMIGMVAFVADVPGGLQSPATALPVQIFLWSDAPERAFEEKTAGAIIVLLAFLLALNSVAVYLRQRFEVES